ncbi:probable cysteine--tRNA ligase, mitochondrial [Cylas formicarius]|uniref:probable cysteine--tRNA ligase, mitochondrial n=1 Tax=Cylas formicarius TaxID=197179 RepID=UPI002958BAA8|nr:probable cysteine--tRNA ligase, mitochondrial [Cylas formicarius]
MDPCTAQNRKRKNEQTGPEAPGSPKKYTKIALRSLSNVRHPRLPRNSIDSHNYTDVYRVAWSYNLNTMFTKNFCEIVGKRLKHTWEAPDGFSTGISIYNCVTRRQEPFVVKNKDSVTWYTCGPTVYDSPHVGHASSYARLDTVRNIMRNHFKLNVVSVMNITDIDEKIIKRARQDKTEAKEIAAKYEKEFWEALDLLKVKQPDVVLRVTKNMDLIVDFIKSLVNSNGAYVAADGSVYFNLSEYQYRYGKLQNIPDNYYDGERSKLKRNPSDFALWKRCDPSEPHWDSPWGAGRPGWHAECSALASHAFGNEIDVHAGGLDLRFPHHENEEAQSCASFDRPHWVNYWMHTGHLHLKDSLKMSKSLKNTVSVSDMLKTCSPDVFRLACASAHYSSPIEYSDDWIGNAANLFKVYKNFMRSCADVEKGFVKPSLDCDVLQQLLNESVTSVDDCFRDDFNTPRAIEVLNRIVSVCNSMIYTTATGAVTGNLHYLVALKNVFCDTLTTFGVWPYESTRSVAERGKEDDIVDVLVNFRHGVRQIGIAQKNRELLNACDGARESLAKLGFSVKDYGKVTSWSR